MNRRKLLTFIGLAPIAPLSCAVTGVPGSVWPVMPGMKEILGHHEIDNAMREIMAKKAAKWTKPEGCTTITIEGVGYRWPLDAHKA